MLYFVSFNPIHRGHIALAEYVIDCGLCDQVALVVSPQNPHKQASELAPELERFTMTELAAKESRYPDNINASIIEFLLEKPSYTINTLDYLVQNHGADMEFSILIGEDNLMTFDKWRSYEIIINHFPIFVYPREGYNATKLLDRVTLLSQAPQHNISSTDIRKAISNGESIKEMVAPSVEQHIIQSKIWRAEGEFAKLNFEVNYGKDRVKAYIERGKWFHRHNEWGKALNDFGAALDIAPDNCEAEEFTKIINEILEFRYKDIYNP